MVRPLASAVLVGMVMNFGHRVMGLVLAAVGLAGCAAEAGEATSTSSQALVAVPRKTVYTLSIEMCEGEGEATLDPFFASFIDASIHQDPTQPRVNMNYMRKSGELRASAELPDDAVIDSVELPAFDATVAPSETAKVIVKLSAEARDGDLTAAPEPIALTCASAAAPAGIYHFRVAGIDQAGGTAFETTNARFIGSTVISFATDGSHSVNDLDLVLPTEDTINLRVGDAITTKIDKLNKATEVPAPASGTKYANVKLTRGSDPGATSRLPGKRTPPTVTLATGADGAMTTSFLARVGEIRR